MAKHRNKLLTILTLTGIILIAGLAVFGSNKLKKGVPITTNLALEAKTEIPLADEKVDIVSPDGQATLTAKKGREVNGIVTQTFYIATAKDNNSLKIYEKGTTSDTSLSVPINTFSPDNKYIFLKYEDTGKTRYEVLRTDGQDLKEGSRTVEIVGLFADKYPDFVVTDVTGWGSYSLIVVNTNTIDGKTGPSWWFDLSNFGFIRLSSRFN